MNGRALSLPTLFGLLLLGLACQTPEEVDLLLVGGKIVTVDDAFSITSSMAVRDGRVVAVGGDELRRRFRAAETLDLAGSTVLPGFNDCHTHISGDARRFLDLTEVTSIAVLQELVRSKAAELGNGEWITGYGWSEDELAEGRRPLRVDLDAAAPANPVVLTRAGGHSAVANSLALELARLDRTSSDPEAGVLERDESGELNGIIRERQDLVTSLVPPASPEELRTSFVANLQDLFRFGITSIVNAITSVEEYDEWRRVYDEHRGELPRAATQIQWAGEEEIRVFGMVSGEGDEHLRIGALKILVDGGFTGPAAYTLEPYKGESEYRGKLNYSEEELRSVVTAAHEMGWQLGFHAIGDAAIVLTVDAFAAALEAAPRRDHRHYLNHFTVMPPAATMERMAELDIHIAQQPNFTYTLEGRYAANLDGERLDHNNPLRTPMEHGIFVALSSDILPIGPRVGLYAAVTRKGRSGTVYAAEERITMEEAIRAYTRGGAFLTFEEESKGSLEPGKLADFVVLSHDLLAIDPETILDVEVEKTFLGGRLVYERKG